MNDHLHELLALVALLFALLLGMRSDPSFDPSNSTPYVSEVRP